MMYRRRAGQAPLAPGLLSKGCGDNEPSASPRAGGRLAYLRGSMGMMGLRVQTDKP